MPLALKSSGGGSVTLDTPVTASTFTLTIPALTATVITDSSGVLNIGSGQLYKDAFGNVGIGTSSPSAKLDVSGNVGFWGSGGSATNRLSFTYNGATGEATIGPNSTGGSTFLTLGTSNAGTYAERARIDSSGNLLVGTTTAIGVGLTIANPAGGSQISIRNTSATAGQYWTVGGTSDSRFYILNAASAGVYLTYGATSWTGTSDERVKDIIEPIQNATTKLANWRTVIGKFKTDEEGTRRSFLMAQDVLKTFPEAVDATNPEEYGLRYQDVIPVLVKAIQELKADLDAAKAEIATLKGNA
jgi:hypothetical protein